MPCDFVVLEKPTESMLSTATFAPNFSQAALRIVSASTPPRSCSSKKSSSFKRLSFGCLRASFHASTEQSTARRRVEVAGRPPQIDIRALQGQRGGRLDSLHGEGRGHVAQRRDFDDSLIDSVIVGDVFC